MKQTLLLITPCLLATPLPEPSTTYEEDQEIAYEGSLRVVIALVSLDMFVDDERLDIPGPPDGETVRETRVAFVDRVAALEDGVPSAFVRSFERIELSVEDPEEGSEDTGVLEGRSIRIERDEDADVVASVADDGGEVDERFLDGFWLPYREELFLPQDDVEPDDSWDLEEDALLEAIGLLAGPDYFDDEGSEGGDEMSEVLRDQADYEATATYLGIEERDGVACWVVAVEGSLEAEIEDFDATLLGMDPAEMGLNPEEVMTTLQAESTHEARVWVSVADHRLAAAESGSEAELVLELAQPSAQGEFRMVMTMAFEAEETETWSTP